jgi:hypothetical protein
MGGSFRIRSGSISKPLRPTPLLLLHKGGHDSRRKQYLMGPFSRASIVRFEPELETPGPYDLKNGRPAYAVHARRPHQL